MSMALFLHSIAFIRREKQGVPLIGCLLVCFLINWDILLVTCGSNQGHLYIFIGFFFFFFIKVVYFQFYNLININNIKKIVDEFRLVRGQFHTHQVVRAGMFIDQLLSWMRRHVWQIVFSLLPTTFFFLDFRMWHFKISKYVFNLLFIRIWFLFFWLLFFLF